MAVRPSELLVVRILALQDFKALASSILDVPFNAGDPLDFLVQFIFPWSDDSSSANVEILACFVGDGQVFITVRSY